VNPRLLARDVGVVAVFKAVVSAFVLVAGFRAVSDDDFARVVIAQSWAHAPRLDASGTSWLPLPFWVTGGTMMVFGRSLGVARAVAFVLGVGSAVVVLVAARWMLGTRPEDRAPVLAGALAAAALPWSARLGVATVPELPTAALMVLAMASLARGDGDGDGAALGRRRLLGGAALLIACLSRYEAWPVACGFAVFCVLDAWRSRGALRGSGRAQTWPRQLAAGALAVVGPVAWLVWNAHAHGSALRFAGRVAAYHDAVNESAPGLLRALGVYLGAAVRAEPELCILALLLAAVALMSDFLPSEDLQADLRNAARPALLTALLIAGLAIAGARSGAPTHHPERALLAPLLLGALLMGAALVRVARAAQQTTLGWVPLAALGTAMITGVLVRWRVPDEAFLPRRDEAAIGRAAAERLPPGEKLLVEAADYGHLAVVAGSGRPEDVIADRSVDPREAARASAFENEATLRARMQEVGATAFAARQASVPEELGRPVAESGVWGLWTGAR
jgi:hypothetical protein